MLSPSEREQIAAKLLASIDEGEPDPEVEKAWAEEITHRAERTRAGEPGIHWDVVRAEARAIIGRR